MFAPQVSGQSRRSFPQYSLGECTTPQSKKGTLYENPARPASPPHYLDTLSKIWLTKEALRELTRRAKQNRSTYCSRPEGHRPLTRRFYAELRNRICSVRTRASDFLQHCSPEILKEVKAFARHGGPNLLDLRGYPEPTHPSRCMMTSTLSGGRRRRTEYGSTSPSRTVSTTADTMVTKITKSSGSSNPNFRQRMVDNGIYPDGYRYADSRVAPKSENWEDIQDMLTKRRASLSPSAFPEEKYEEFKEADDRVSSERKATEEVIPKIQGAIRNPNCIGGDIPFYNLSPMMRGKDHSAKPDVYYGARPEQLNDEICANPDDNDDNDTRKYKLGKYVMPSTICDRPCAPNFFVETKGPSGSGRISMDQACFVGAAGARGMHKLQTYEQQMPTYDNKAYTLSATYHAGTLKMYAHHLGQPGGPGTQPKYYMNQLKAWAMTSDRETLLKGMTAFRNGVDWAGAQRNAAIEHAEAIANSVGNNDEEDKDEEHDDDDDNDDDNDEEA